jgi:hypothetical protein
MESASLCNRLISSIDNSRSSYVGEALSVARDLRSETEDCLLLLREPEQILVTVRPRKHDR